MTIRVCIAGATGWTGSALVAAVAAAPDLVLAGAVARTAAGQDVGVTLGGQPLAVTVSATVEAALDAAAADVLVDFTKPGAVKRHALTALGRRVAVVIGTSGLTAEDYAEIDAAARAAGVGAMAAGSFSITATLLQRFALMAARYIGDVEVVDYASAGKPDVPSGTARELAERLTEVRSLPSTAVPVAALHGPQETRGARIGDVPVHSLRLPSYVIACEAIFGLPDERLTLRHDAGSGAAPYVAGTLLAVRKVGGFTGLRRGLDSILDPPG